LTKENILTNKDLAKIMKAYCPSYNTYEYEDVLDILAEVIEQEVLKSNTIRLGNIGLFWLKRNVGRKSFNVTTRQMEELPESCTVGFKVAKQLQHRVREKTRQPKKGSENETPISE
jgi:nucleoid DNA-binding protein